MSLTSLDAYEVEILLLIGDRTYSNYIYVSSHSYNDVEKHLLPFVGQKYELLVGPNSLHAIAGAVVENFKIKIVPQKLIFTNPQLSTLTMTLQRQLTEQFLSDHSNETTLRDV